MQDQVKRWINSGYPIKDLINALSPSTPIAVTYYLPNDQKNGYMINAYFLNPQKENKMDFNGSDINAARIFHMKLEDIARKKSPIGVSFEDSDFVIAANYLMRKFVN